jgi:hypothetical protein
MRKLKSDSRAKFRLATALHLEDIWNAVISDVSEAGDMTEAIGISLYDRKQGLFMSTSSYLPTAESHESSKLSILPHLAIDKELRWVFWS